MSPILQSFGSDSFGAFKSIFSIPLITSGMILKLDASDTSSYPGTGTTWFDLSGNNAHGTLAGSVSFVSNGPASYFNFPAQADTNYISSSVSQNYVDGFVVFYPDFSATSGLVTLISQGAGIDKSLRFAGANGSAAWTTNTPGDANDWGYPSTTWYDNGSTGASSLTLTSGWNIFGGYKTNQSTFPASFAYNIGAGYTGRGFKGRIAMVVLYNRQLTAAETAQNFASIRSRFSL